MPPASRTHAYFTSAARKARHIIILFRQYPCRSLRNSEVELRDRIITGSTTSIRKVIVTPVDASDNKFRVWKPAKCSIPNEQYILLGRSRVCSQTELSLGSGFHQHGSFRILWHLSSGTAASHYSGLKTPITFLFNAAYIRYSRAYNDARKLLFQQFKTELGKEMP